MFSPIIKYGLPLLAAGLLVFSYVHVIRSHPPQERLEPPAKPARTAYKATVAASGIIEARGENIALGATVAGIVLEAYVAPSDVGKNVTKGTPLFKVDDRHLQATLQYQRSNVSSAEAQLNKLLAMPRKEELPPSKAKAQAAESNYKMTKDLADRAAYLVNSKSIAQEDFMQRQLSMEVARHQMEQARADFALLEAGSWKPDLEVSRAALELAKAQVKQTETEIERTIVRASVDGQILQVNVRPGEYVGSQPGQSLVMLGDLTKMHVRVDIDEHDIPRFHPGAAAKAFLRGDASRELALTFLRVEPYVTPKRMLTGDNTERVDTRVLQAIYIIDGREKHIYVGQQLDVFIDAHPQVREETEIER